MNFERLMLCSLTLYLLYLLYRQHRTHLRRLWQRNKGRLPRPWNPVGCKNVKRQLEMGISDN